MLICLYVDNMLIFSSNINAIKETKRSSSNKFDMKDLGETDVILGVKFIKRENGYTLSQSHCIEKLLTKFDSFEVTLAQTLYDSSVKLSNNLETCMS